MPTAKFKVISLFSGGMGLDLGLDRTDRFKLLACVEKVPAYCETIRANQKAGRLPAKMQLFASPIEELDPLKILESVGLKPGELDVLVGGPPCQSFSTTGKRGTVQDPRGTLLWQYMRFVEVMRPKFFVMENVRGLLSAALRHRTLAERPNKGGSELEDDEQPGSVVRTFAEDLNTRTGGAYHMDCFEVNAVNYGAPQLRERAIFIGNLYNAVVDFPDPTHGPSEASTRQRCLFDEEALQPWRTLRDAIGDLNEENPEVLDFSPRKKSFLEMIPPGGNWRSLPVEIQKESMGAAWHAKGGRSGWWRRLTFDLPCPTLLTMPNHAGTALCHPSETRALSLKEYARIQEFPDEWQFCGKTADKYAQVGNAVPVRLGQVAGEIVAAELDALKARKWQAYPTKPDAFRIKYVQSHVRTRQWFKGGEMVVWEDGKENVSATYAAPKTKRKNTVLSEK